MWRILAADIGATNARFALYEARADGSGDRSLTLTAERWLKGTDFPEFEALLDALFLPDEAGVSPFAGPSPDVAVIAPAGPIVGESCRVSNLPWTIKADHFRARFGLADVHLLNDFAAQAYACLLPEQVSAQCVRVGTPVTGALQAVMGAGTGLGCAMILPGSGHTGTSSSGTDILDTLAKARILPSEGGHADFAFSGPDEQAYARFLADRTGRQRLIGDTVLNGQGLAYLFTFLTGDEVTPFEASAQAARHPKVLEWYARFTGRACRNFLLSTLATGGLFITGGMAARVPVLGHPAFLRELAASAAHRELLERIPVWHVKLPQAGLWGAALFGLIAVRAQRR